MIEIVEVKSKKDVKEFINFPAIRFKKTDISHDKLKNIFYDEEQIGLLWRLSYISALNSQNYNLANSSHIKEIK